MKSNSALSPDACSFIVPLLHGIAMSLMRPQILVLVQWLFRKDNLILWGSAINGRSSLNRRLTFGNCSYQQLRTPPCEKITCEARFLRVCTVGTTWSLSSILFACACCRSSKMHSMLWHRHWHWHWQRERERDWDSRTWSRLEVFLVSATMRGDDIRRRETYPRLESNPG